MFVQKPLVSKQWQCLTARTHCNGSAFAEPSAGPDSGKLRTGAFYRVRLIRLVCAGEQRPLRVCPRSER